MLESVYVRPPLPLHPASPHLLLTNKPGRNLSDDFISQMMSWEIRASEMPFIPSLVFPPVPPPSGFRLLPLSIPDLPLSHSKEPDPFVTERFTLLPSPSCVPLPVKGRYVRLSLQ